MSDRVAARGARATTVLAVVGIGLGCGLSPDAFAHERERPGGVEIAFGLGWFAPRGESDLWEENERLLTVDPDDFDGVMGSAAVGWRVSEHGDLVLGLHYHEEEEEVRYRYIVGEFGDPVVQTHRLRQVPVELSFRFLPIPREELRGRGRVRAVRPAVPYFGAGFGGVFWDYVEAGEFVDDHDDPFFAFPDRVESSGLAPSAHVLAGLEIQFGRETALQIEGRYRWAEGDLDAEFGPGRDRLDLSGGSLSAWLSFRF